MAVTKLKGEKGEVIMPGNRWVQKAVFAVFAIVGIVLISQPAGAQVTAPDLTGTWEGQAFCRFFNGVPFQGACCFTMEITKVTDTTFHLRLPHPNPEAPEAPDLLYFGKVIPDAARPGTKGEVAFVDCPTANTLPRN